MSKTILLTILFLFIGCSYSQTFNFDSNLQHTLVTLESKEGDNASCSMPCVINIRSSREYYISTSTDDNEQPHLLVASSYGINSDTAFFAGGIEMAILEIIYLTYLIAGHTTDTVWYYSVTDYYLYIKDNKSYLYQRENSVKLFSLLRYEEMKKSLNDSSQEAIDDFIKMSGISKDKIINALMLPCEKDCAERFSEKMVLEKVVLEDVPRYVTKIKYISEETGIPMANLRKALKNIYYKKNAKKRFIDFIEDGMKRVREGIPFEDVEKPITVDMKELQGIK